MDMRIVYKKNLYDNIKTHQGIFIIIPFLKNLLLIAKFVLELSRTVKYE